MDTAEAVRELLERSGLTKSMLSARTGVSRSLLDAYLKGQRQPSLTQLQRLGQGAGLRLDVAWRPVQREDDVRDEAGWLIADNPAMRPVPLTTQQRAQVLARVVVVTMAQRRHERGALTFPPFRTLAGRSDV